MSLHRLIGVKIEILWVYTPESQKKKKKSILPFLPLFIWPNAVLCELVPVVVSSVQRNIHWSKLAYQGKHISMGKDDLSMTALFLIQH